MILLIESHKHYSLISSSGAAAGGWELPAAATEAVLEGIGPGRWGGWEGREGIQGHEPHHRGVLSSLLLLPLTISLGWALPMGMPQFGKTIISISHLKGILGQAPQKGPSLSVIFL